MSDSMLREADWEDIRTFTALARTGTVRGASEALGVHYSTISRRLEQLEKTLAVRLFDRGPQGLELTDAGEELRHVTEPFAQQIFDVQRRISGQDTRLSGRLSITMAEPLAEHAFAPRLPGFAAQYPDLELEIQTTTDFLGISRREADIAIRMDNNPPSSLVGRRFFPYHDSVYAAPGYLEDVNPVRLPTDARWLGWEFHDTRHPEWIVKTEFPSVPVWGSFPTLRMQVAAARAGLGIAMLPCFIADRDPGLVRITRHPPHPSRDIWLLTHADLRRTARIRAGLEFSAKVITENRSRLLGKLENQTPQDQEGAAASPS